jgi:hypothetical protein
MPYSDSDRLVAVWEDASAIGFARNTPATANYVDWRRLNNVFTDMAALRFRVANLTGEGRPELVMGRCVAANFCEVLGARPLLGHAFTMSFSRVRLCFLAMCTAAVAQAVELRIEYAALERMLAQTLFSQEGRKYVHGGKNNKCSFIYLENPQVPRDTGS